MSRKNSGSVVCEFDSLCLGVCLKSLTATGKEIKRKKKEKKRCITLGHRGKVPNQLPGRQ